MKSLPGSHEFASDFIETIATDPDPRGRNRNAVWALTADLSTEVPADERAMYISKSVDGGGTWTEVARIDSKFFDAEIGEGLRNGLSVYPGGTEFVITTQLGSLPDSPSIQCLKTHREIYRWTTSSSCSTSAAGEHSKSRGRSRKGKHRWNNA